MQAAAASVCGWEAGAPLAQAGEGGQHHSIPSEADVSLLGRRLFVESFDVSGFIFLGFCHPFHRWRAPTVGKSGAALDKKYVLGEGTRGNSTGN